MFLLFKDKKGIVLIFDLYFKQKEIFHISYRRAIQNKMYKDQEIVFFKCFEK